MPRSPRIDRPTQLVMMLPESVRARVDLELFSELEGRVPHGAYTRFFQERLREYFDSKRLDLEVLGLPAGFYVQGPKEMIEALEKRMKEIER